LDIIRLLKIFRPAAGAAIEEARCKGGAQQSQPGRIPAHANPKPAGSADL